MTAEDAIQALTRSLNKGLTGCLSSRSDGAYRVYVMQGELLAAHGPDDGIWVVRRLVNNGAITDSQGRQVTFYLGQGYRLEELLLDQVPDQLFLDLLVERFRQNILDFSYLSGPMQFEEMEAIFVDNIQVGHDSRRLLAEILKLREQVTPLRQQINTLRLKAGSGHPGTRQEARLLDLCTGEMQLDALLAMSPHEEGLTLSIIQSMLEGGVLVDVSAPPAPAPAQESDLVFEVRERPPHKPSQSNRQHSSTLQSAHRPDLSEADTVTDDPVQALSRTAPQDPFFDPFSADPVHDDPPPPGDPFRGESFEERGGFEDQGGFEERATLDDAIQRAREQEERRQAARSAASRSRDGMLSTQPVSDRARQALAYEEEVDADEMAMFEDYDVRRGGGKGQFSVDRKLLDRVDLGRPIVESKPPAEVVDDDLLEMGDTSDMTDSERAGAFSLSFGPPPLDLSEQRHKIDVCNDVLSELSQAIDQTHGPGSGRACVQLLIDGTPHQYAVLFMGVETDTRGCIDASRVIKNLQRRPESEHRRLMNMGMLNLIERALSSGMEELDESTMDAMLQRVAGYQMRLGL